MLRRSKYFPWLYRLSQSYMFWRIFPWVVSVSCILVVNFILLLYAMRYFAFNSVLLHAWLETLGIALGFGFVVVDIIVIVIRNNLWFTKGILQTRQYQILEKFVIAPLMGVYKVLEKNFFNCWELCC